MNSIVSCNTDNIQCFLDTRRQTIFHKVGNIIVNVFTILS